MTLSGSSLLDPQRLCLYLWSSRPELHRKAENVDTIESGAGSYLGFIAGMGKEETGNIETLFAISPAPLLEPLLNHVRDRPGGLVCSCCCLYKPGMWAASAPGCWRINSGVQFGERVQETGSKMKKDQVGLGVGQGECELWPNHIICFVIQQSSHLQNGNNTHIYLSKVIVRIKTDYPGDALRTVPDIQYP